MPNKIQVLNEIVINRIAAGEVVERPASIVKELIENSIDAMATTIQLDIENGGRKLIRVRDNGIGISHDDAFLALERHATSKLRSEKDLTRVPTLGFRGEALASIASVSRIRFMTKDEFDDVGTRIVSDGGKIRNAEPVAMNQGTIVEVRDVFYNAPVRRKYLRSAPLESGFIHDLVLKIAIANPFIGFTFYDDGKIKVQ
ncbi:MAG: DNA mismatch repair endonuclease MutL, partial [Desulfomonilaceae bacterium]